MELNTILIILLILFIHWIADFVLQSDWMATNKSRSNIALNAHTITYSAVWLIPIALLANIHIALAFAGITLICHTITDYFTSRLNSKLWEKKQVHNFFVSVGFDQWLHYVQLFLTYYYLTNG